MGLFDLRSVKFLTGFNGDTKDVCWRVIEAKGFAKAGMLFKLSADRLNYKSSVK